ncbi:hypothetical protein TNCV_5082201 [Trichonephila clavipes]|nr:hypothetical protein TNCV_5082201 [Trichonephila clavipes]
MLEKVIENGTSRLDYIRACRGSPMPEIIFKNPRAESDLRVSLLDNGLVGPYSDTVLVTPFSPGSSTCASRVR